MNRIDQLFTVKKKDILNVYCTAGYPALTSTTEVLATLQTYGADLIEIGMPYSDPLADGPVIQQSSMVALENGMTIATLFEQLENVRTQSPSFSVTPLGDGGVTPSGDGGKSIQVPLILMGYMNPVLQYGLEKFCKDAEAVGVDGIILPDLPMYEYETQYRQLFEKHNLHFIFLVTPETDEERIRKIDALSSGFIYAVSSSSTTGNSKPIEGQSAYFEKLQGMQLKNPILVGFGIKDKATFQAACAHTNGAIIGSAYINELKQHSNIDAVTKEFLKKILD